jgi:Kdo2-lipid IVA lauroyltransferase/acyltransferase
MLLSSFCGEKKKGSFWHGAPDFQLGILIYSLRTPFTVRPKISREDQTIDFAIGIKYKYPSLYRTPFIFMKHRPKHIVEYILLRALLGIVNILPLRIARSIGWTIGALFFYVFRFRAVEAQRRLEEVYGDRFSPKERKKIAWISFRNICFNAIEAARFSKMTTEQVQQMPLYQTLDKILQHHQNEGPLIVATAHMGNWDLAGVASQLIGLPVFSIARRQSNPLTDELLNQMRNATGMEVVLNDSRVLQNVVRKLKKGGVLAILPDVRSRKKALSIDFLGGQANLGAGTALFAQMAKCPIIPVVLTRRGWAQHEGTAFDLIIPDPSKDKKEEHHRMMQELATVFTDAIAQQPEQYFWFNKRWVLDPLKKEVASCGESHNPDQ